MAAQAGEAAKFTNRLAKETSPYLLQHAHNPVDWYPWGEEAFARARAENKPIFLSVGYSTCYWCHVMERQSFENEQVAGEMNRLFVNIKVDREERPDVDQLYMTAVQVLTHAGGWPMSVFLRPDLRPFYGGTYFPPTDQYGRPGFLTILRAIEDAYRNRPEDVEKTSAQLTDILRQLAEPAAPREDLKVDWGLVDELIDRSTGDYEPQYGGFGAAPKFPRETLLELLLTYVAQRPSGDARVERRKRDVLRMVRHALDAMANGGIRDQLGGGFHRYSTDARWLVPHFEIMLYDNAMLGWVYTEAHRQTGEARYAEVARGVFDFVLREMTSPQGAFYTAFDAEVDAMEGLSYLWKPEEIVQVLGGEDAALFNRVYGVDRGPNFEDPHHGKGGPDQNILYLPDGITPDTEARVAPMREKLYAERAKRKQPMLDTKVITSWNALMVRAMAFAGKTLAEPRYTKAAQRCADYLLQFHGRTDGGFWRTSRDGVVRHEGFLDDYAYLVQALLELGREHEARRTMAQLHQRFGDPQRGGFYFTQSGAADLIVRQKVASDSPLPSGNAVAALAAMELGEAEPARRTIAVFARQIEGQGEGMSSMVQAAMAYLTRAQSFVVPGAGEAARPSDPEELAGSVVELAAAWQTPRELHVRLSIAKGFHLNAHDAAKGMVATRLAISEFEAAVEYPPGEEQAFAFAEEKMKVYSGEVILVARFPEEMTGTGLVRCGVTYQACSDDACLPAVTKQFELDTP